jgi:hypothetical protein
VPRSVAAQSSSVRNTGATFPFITATSTAGVGSVVASPCSQRTAPAPRLARAIFRLAYAGSTPTTSMPRPVNVQANVPVRQPMSRTDRVRQLVDCLDVGRQVSQFSDFEPIGFRL